MEQCGHNSFSPSFRSHWQSLSQTAEDDSTLQRKTGGEVLSLLLETVRKVIWHCAHILSRETSRTCVSAAYLFGGDAELISGHEVCVKVY